MALKKMALAATLLAALSTLSGCASMSSVESMASSSVVKDMAGKLFGNWDLTKLMGQDVSSLLPAGAKTPNLSFSPDGKVSGFGGVNRLSTSLDPKALATGDLKLAPAAATKMAGPTESMKVEDQFFSALTKVTGYKIDGDTLSLKNGADTLMQFVKAK